MEGETQATNMKYCIVHTPQTHKLALGKFNWKAGGSKVSSARLHSIAETEINTTVMVKEADQAVHVYNLRTKLPNVDFNCQSRWIFCGQHGGGLIQLGQATFKIHKAKIRFENTLLRQLLMTESKYKEHSTETLIAETQKIWPSKLTVAVNILGRISTPNPVVQGACHWDQRTQLSSKPASRGKHGQFLQAQVTDLTTKRR